MALPPLYVSLEEMEREREELRRLREDYERKWRRLRGVVENVRRWERRVADLERLLEHLRAGLPATWREYVRVRDIDLPRARGRLFYWGEEREAIIREIYAQRAVIRAAEEELARKVPPVLFRVKIRLYNMERKPTPTGMFQTFWDVDALVDPETGLVNWDWRLTKDEVQICKYHMVGYFKGMAKWRTPEQMSLAYFEPTGVPYEEELAKYKYSKNVPREFIARAETLTVGELIVGISSVEPRPVREPEGVFFQRAMIIDADGVIKWDEVRNRWVWRPTKGQIGEVKKELKIE